MSDEIDDILAGAGLGEEGAEDASGGDMDLDSLLGESGGADAGDDDAGTDDLMSQAAGGQDMAQAHFDAPGAGVEVHGEPAKMEEILRDVPVTVRVEFGRKNMLIKDLLRLSPGSVVDLDRPASDPVHIYVNRHLIGEGEIMVQKDETFCVRITKLYEHEES